MLIYKRTFMCAFICRGPWRLLSVVNGMIAPQATGENGARAIMPLTTLNRRHGPRQNKLLTMLLQLNTRGRILELERGAGPRHKTTAKRPMTKTQIRAKLRRLAEQLGDANALLYDLASEINDLQNEVEETRDEIEPYENHDDLTEQQEERYEYLDELASDLEEMASDLESVADDLSNVVSNLEDKQYE